MHFLRSPSQIYEQRAEDPDVVAVLYPKPTTLSRRVPTEDAGLLAFLERYVCERGREERRAREGIGTDDT